MSEIFIKPQIFEMLLKIASDQDISIETLCHRVFKEYIINSPKLQIEPKDSEDSHIIAFYRNIYKAKFGLPTTEDINLELVDKISLKINEITEDAEKADLMLKKAIAWYIYHNDNLNQEGSKIPHRLNTLFKESWLFQKAVESTAGKTLEYVMKSGESDIDSKTFNKAMKRGDVGGQYHENASSQVEDLLIRLETIIQTYDDGKTIKKHPKLSKLYESETPSLDYIKEARKYVERMENE